MQTLPPAHGSASISDAWREIREGNAPNHGVGFVFTLPLTRRAERSRYRASHELRAQAELRLKQQEEWVLREIADAADSVRYSWDRVGLTRRARMLAVEALAAEERKLAGGKSTIFFVLQLQGDLASAESSEARARGDYLQALARLSFANGTLLERHGLHFQDESSSD